MSRLRLSRHLRDCHVWAVTGLDADPQTGSTKGRELLSA